MSVQCHRVLFIGAIHAAVVACSESTGLIGEPGIRVLSSVTPSDTVLALVGNPLVIEVRDSAGVRRPGVTVRFAPVQGSRAVYAMADTAAPPRVPYLVPTDGNGRATAHIRLGTETGVARLAIEVRSLDYADTVSFNILPGSAARISFAPADTAVYTGATYTLQGRTLDMFDNPRNDVVQLSSGSSGVSVDGSTVRATATIGRERIIGQSGSVTGAALLSIVPHGVLAVRNFRFQQPEDVHSFAMFELDGSDYRPLNRRSASDYVPVSAREVALHWAPSGDHLIFSDGDYYHRLYRMSLDGAVRQLFAPPTGQSDHWSQYTRDGAWILFSRNTPAYYRVNIFRARANGSEQTRLSPGTESSYQIDLWPSPSPDGRHIVYATDREPGDGYRLWVQEIATGTVRALNVNGESPRWSPNSDWIAFVDQSRVKVIRADGSGLRTLSSPGKAYSWGLDWSPDGRWVVAASGSIDLIELETGLTLPLAFARGFLEPTWKPR